MANDNPSNRYYTLIILLLVYTSSHIDRNILAILLEPIKADLDLSDTQLGFLSGIAFAIFYGTLGIPVAWMADRGNRRNIIALAITLWSGMTALCGVAGNFFQLALARIGVGVGEAGAGPPAISMISSIFPERQRATAMAVYTLGVYLGIMFGYMLGGWINDAFGWRAAFIIVGLPGILLGAIVRFTIREPERTISIYDNKKEFTLSLKEGLLFYVRSPAARHVLIAYVLAATIGYGLISWLPSFFIRSHGLTPSEVGMFLAPVLGIVGGVGVLFGGRLADILGRKSHKTPARLVSVSKLITVPVFILFFTMENTNMAIAVYAFGYFFSAFFPGPTFAMIQTLAPENTRAMAAALMLASVNLIGLGLGPQLIGIASDMLNAAYGQESLRYALLAASLLNLWAAVHYWLASDHYAKEREHSLMENQEGI